VRSWSQRRAAVAAEAHAEAVAQDAAVAEAFEAEQAERTDTDILEELGLPDPDTLEAGADFKGFLAKNVPERIKTRALRRLWRLNPVLANLDGLVDYDDDYTDAACVVDGMKTAYQVGKGMLKHIEALAEQAEAEAENEAIAARDLPAEAEAADDVEGDLVADAEQPAVTSPAYTFADADTDDGSDSAPQLRRRMTFTFEETA